MSEGLLDTNVFIHAQSHDEHAADCRAFLAALEAGAVQARLEPIVLHELSYVLPRFIKQMVARSDVAVYLLTVLSWTGVTGEKELMVGAVNRWCNAPGLSFADAYLAVLATMRGCPVYSKNRAELLAQGVAVPPTLSAPPASLGGQAV